MSMKISRILPAAFAIFAAFACSREIPSGKGHCMGMPVSFSASSRVVKASVTETDGGLLQAVWETGDCVGIFASTMSMMIGENVPYEVDASASEPFRCALKPVDETVVWSGDSEHQFWAYAPWHEDVTDVKAIPFSISSAQTQVALDDISALSESLLLKADPVNLTPEDGTLGDDVDVAFTFRQFLPVMEIRVNACGDALGTALSRVSLTSKDTPLAAAKGRFDLTAPPADAIIYDEIASRVVSVTFDNPQVLSAAPGSVYLVVAPGRYENLALTLSFRDGTSHVTSLSPCTLASGTRYVSEVCIGEEDAVSGAVELPCCISFASEDGKLSFGSVNANTASFDGGMRLERDIRNAEASGRSYSSNLVAGAQSMISSAAWSLSSAYMFTIPLANPLSGRVRLDFKFMPRGWAEWIAEWSGDGMTWYSSTSGKFIQSYSTQTSSCCQYLDIPSSRSIPAGGCLYLRLRPFSDLACIGGDIRTTDASADPALMQALILTPCTPRPESPVADALYSCMFNDCTEGIDVIGLGPDKVLGFCNVDGPLYASYRNIWQRYGHVRVGAPGQTASFFTDTFAMEEGETAKVNVSLRLASYRGPDGQVDDGTVNLVLCNGGKRTSQTYEVKSSAMKADAWTDFSFVFENATAASAIEIYGSSVRFYLDEIIVRRAGK